MMGTENTLDFHTAMRRIVTGNSDQGRSTIIIDGPPAFELGGGIKSGLHEIWTERLATFSNAATIIPDDPSMASLSPLPNQVKARWFTVHPENPNVDLQKARAASRKFFQEIGAEHELADQTRHPTMHQTDTLDIVCLISGKASLILDETQTELHPGQVVIQRGTAHAWIAHDAPALFLAILIARTDNK